MPKRTDPSALFRRQFVVPHCIFDMAPDHHSRACANTLMRPHGDDAWFDASQRANESLVTGDPDGDPMSKAILARIEILEQMAPTGSVR